MSSGVRVPLADAENIAQMLGNAVLPYCYRVEICGSIRRREEAVGDIDLVCQPIVKRQADLFGDMAGPTTDLLDDRLTWLLERGHVEQRLDVNGRASWGASLKRAIFRGMAVDIQAVHDADTWGAWLVIRTGPASFIKSLMTPRRQGGLLPAGCEFKDGFQLWKWGERVPTPTEPSLFDALGLEYVRPEDRK